MNKINQIITGTNNIQSAGDIYINPILNISLTELRIFEKILNSVPLNRFKDEIIRPYFENKVPGISEHQIFQLTTNLLNDEQL